MTMTVRTGHRPAWYWLPIVMALALAIRLIYFGGIDGADDMSTAAYALNMARGIFDLPVSHYGLRLGLTVPLGGIFAVFGVGEWQLALLPLLYSLLGIFLAYDIARRLGDDTAGLLAALVLALFPLDVLAATVYFPDVPLGVSLALAFSLGLRAVASNRPYAWAVAAGLVWGFGYMVKIEAVFMGVVFLALAAQHRDRWRQVALIIVVFGAVVLGESLVYLALTGRFPYRLLVIGSTTGVMSKEYSAAQLWIFPKTWFVTFYDFGLHYYFLFAAWLWALATRQRALYPVLVWVAVYLLWLQFGGNPFSASYSVKSHLARYSSYVSVPMAVLIAHLLTRSWIGRRKTAFAAAVGAMALAGLFFINFTSLNNERQVATKEALAYALRTDAFPLYMDQGSYDLASFLLAGRAEKDRIFSIQKHNFQTGKTELLDLDRLQGYLLLNKGFMRYRARRYFMDAVNEDSLKGRYEMVYSVNNPMGRLAYLQTRMMAFAASFLPSRFLREKIAGTARELLEGEDAVIFRLTSPPASRSDQNRQESTGAAPS